MGNAFGQEYLSDTRIIYARNSARTFTLKKLGRRAIGIIIDEGEVWRVRRYSDESTRDHTFLIMDSTEASFAWRYGGMLGDKHFNLDEL